MLRGNTHHSPLNARTGEERHVAKEHGGSNIASAQRGGQPLLSSASSRIHARPLPTWGCGAALSSYRRQGSRPPRRERTQSPVVYTRHPTRRQRRNTCRTALPPSILGACALGGEQRRPSFLYSALRSRAKLCNARYTRSTERADQLHKLPLSQNGS